MNPLNSYQNLDIFFITPLATELHEKFGIHYPPKLIPGFLVFYLPRGLISTPDPRDDEIVEGLSLSSNATIIRINYRLSQTQKYPTPVHDVLAGYDWVLKHFVPTVTNPNIKIKLGVCGELVGGGLALTLALTESWVERHGIKAVAVGNPITEWQFPDTLLMDEQKDAHQQSEGGLEEPHKIRRVYKKRTSWTMFGSNPLFSSKQLLSLRRAVFQNAPAIFDPFASPLYFLRTPGLEIPTWHDIPVDALTSPELREEDDLIIRRRKVARYFPPRDSDLRIPPTRILAGRNSLLCDQAVEMVKWMRKSVVVSESNLESIFDGDENEMARRRVQLATCNGLGLWGMDTDDLFGVGRWLKDVE
ncbi:MAG: hypothetical protein M1834_007285 [Cirrosporium novae-zelandiae]|nr:MAG: hypothetical protein M1834_007285 [Cirrosporium novae-zelandiae]